MKIGRAQPHALYRVLGSTPINRQARVVTSQRGCSEFEADLDRQDLIEIVERLQRKHRLLKVVLQVSRPSQHTNLIARHKMGLRSNFRPARAIEEYVRIGKAVQILITRLAELNREVKAGRQLLGKAENEWRAAHPGCIWDGKQLVAPNGAVFSRVQVAAHAEGVAA